ncbi:MAG: LysR family transcriptional regulator [Novosphingobium sp.]
MIKLDGIPAFVATIDEGSISAASRRLGLAKSVVSERLAEMERTLGVTLLQRSTRSLALTGAGQTFLARARRILREMEEAAAELDASAGKLVMRLPAFSGKILPLKCRSNSTTASWKSPRAGSMPSFAMARSATGA